MKNKINSIITYIVGIIIVLKSTVIASNAIFSKIASAFFLISGIVLVYNARSMDYKKVLKENYLIVIYMTIRLLSVLILSDKVANLKTLFYEIYFWGIVYLLFNKDKKTFYNLLLILIVLNFFINIMTIVLVIFGRDEYLTTIYANTNPMGSLTCVCMLLFMIFFSKKISKPVSIAYIIFSIIVIIVSKSRTPIIIIVFYIFSRIIMKYKILNLTCLKKSFICLLNVFLVCVILFSYATKFKNTPSDLELKLNNYTTNRYYLWKYSIISLEKSPIVGIGEINIGEKRRAEVPKERFIGLDLSRNLRLSKNNNHNGYFQLLVANGYLNYIVFMYWLYKNSVKLPMKKFYIVSAILILNIFETQLMMTVNMGGFLLMYFLGMEKNNE